MLNIVKLYLFYKSGTPTTLNKIKSLKHFPSSTREWNNSIYVYNKNNLNLILSTTISAINMVKSFFSLYSYKLERKMRTKRFSRRFRRLSSNKIYVSNGEFKHTNNKVVIDLYLFNRQKYNYVSTIKKLFLKTIFRMKNKFKRGKFQMKNKFRGGKFQMKNKFKRGTQISLSKFWKKKYDRFLIKQAILDKRKQIDIKIKNYRLRHFKHNNKVDNKIIKSRIKKNKSNIRRIEYKLKMFNFRLVDKLHYSGHKKFNEISLDTSFYKSEKFIPSINKDIIIKTFKVKYNKFFNKIVKHKPKIKAKEKVKEKKFKLTDFNKFITKKVNRIREKGLGILRLVNKEKYIIVNVLRQDKEKKIIFFISAYITKFYKNFISRSFKKLKIYFYYRELLYINKSKYNYNYLQYLSKHLYSLYNKNIEYNLINLKRFYLHSDILSESITLKITRNRKRLLRKLKRLEKKIWKKIRRNQSFLGRNNSKKKINQDIKYTYLSIIPKNSVIKRKKIVERINHKYITGFRLEAKGRLTRRYTASRSVSKTRYKGNLLNLYTLGNGLSSVLLKGNLKSNLQYTKLKSKSRIGSFGIKGWISGN